MAKKSRRAIEIGLGATAVAAVGGFLLGAAVASLLPRFPEIPNTFWIVSAFFGVLIIAGMIVGVCQYDDAVTRLVETSFSPLDDEQFRRSIEATRSGQFESSEKKR